MYLIYFFLLRQPDELTDVLEISNIVFTSMFVLEMIFKLMAFGIFGYIKNPYNIFDGIIVVIRYSTFYCLAVHLCAMRHPGLCLTV